MLLNSVLDMHRESVYFTYSELLNKYAFIGIIFLYLLYTQLAEN